MRKRISPAERRHMDYLRKKGLLIGKAYENRLLKLRRKEVRRVLDLCMDYHNPMSWSAVIEQNLDESYLDKWFQGLYIEAGLPRAKSVARDMNKAKAADDEGYWEQELLKYANQRAGENIVLVQNTLRDNLIEIVRKTMESDTQMGIEKLARSILKGYSDIALWQARRIAQTEAMISLAEAGDIAARSLDIPFVKTWAVSGLGNTRDSHLEMDGMTVEDDEPFQLIDCQMMYPHDGSMGAPAGEIINCACDCIRRPK